MKQIFKFDEIKKLKKLIKGRKVVVVGGCFDVVHLGHLIFLEEAKKRGNFLLIFLESDESIRKNKGEKRPINNQKNRAFFLTKLKIVDGVLCLPEMKNEDYQNLLSELNPSVIAVTEDDKNLESKIREAKLIGAKVVKVTKQIPSQSTSRIIEIITQDL